MSKESVNVAVGVVMRGDKVFIAKRHKKQHQGGLWEFPGGKIEPSESPEQALARELYEELGIVIANCEHLLTHAHDYGDKYVVLHTYIVKDFDLEPNGQEGQKARWIAYTQLQELAFPDANKVIIEALLSSL